MFFLLIKLLYALVQSKNEAADDVLVEALRLGDPQEKRPVLEALLSRKTIHGLCGIISLYDSLPELLQRHILAEIGQAEREEREGIPDLENGSTIANVSNQDQRREHDPGRAFEVLSATALLLEAMLGQRSCTALAPAVKNSNYGNKPIPKGRNRAPDP